MSFSYPNMLKKFRKRYNERDILKNINQRVSMEIGSLKSTKTCISLGTGYGEYDIDFIQICLPNLKKLIVVEKNPECVEELKKNLKTTFGDRLEVDIYEMHFENFMKIYKGDNIDLIISFHALYFVTSAERPKFFDLCFNSWLNPEKGLLIYIACTQTNDWVSIVEKFGHKVKHPQHNGHIKNDIKTLGYQSILEIPYHDDLDFRIYDHDLCCIIFSITGVIFTQDTIMKAVNEVAPTGIAKASVEFSVVCKCH